LPTQVLFKIDIPANRYDMLCLEGISRALNIFNRRIRRVDYRLADMTGARISVAAQHSGRLLRRCCTVMLRSFLTFRRPDRPQLLPVPAACCVAHQVLRAADKQ